MNHFVKLFLFFQFSILSTELFAARQLVVFKSERGFEIMQSYFESNKAYFQSSSERAESHHGVQALRHVQSFILTEKQRHLAESLKNHPEVLFVEEERWTPLPHRPRLRERISAKSSRRRTPAPKPSPSVPNLPEFQRGEATPWGILAVAAPDAWRDSAAGVQARVMVLDTGVDENHPALANNFEKGRNFILNDQDQRLNESAYQDTDGHGTHCAGTILGDYNPQTGFTGVAPRAKLLAGRVCGDDGCSNISVVQGLDWAISEQVDVVNLSLGGDYYTPSEKQAIERAEKAGLVVVAASGNSADEQDYSPDKKLCPGDSRYFPNKCGVGFPAAYSSVVAVGALDFNLERAVFSQWGPELDLVAPGVDVLSSVPVGLGRISEVRLNTPDGAEKIKSSLFSRASQGAVSMSGELVAVPGVGLATDFSSVDVTGKIALVSRGEIKFAEKIKNAIEAKAKALVIYNNVPGLMQGDLGGDEQIADYPVVMIEQAVASDIVRRLSANEQLTLNLDIHVTDYEMFEGTSMAAPHVSGVVALMRSANKRLRPSQIRQILSSSATELAGDNQSNQLGAGLVSAARAVEQSKNHH